MASISHAFLTQGLLQRTVNITPFPFGSNAYLPNLKLLRKWMGSKGKRNSRRLVRSRGWVVLVSSSVISGLALRSNAACFCLPFIFQAWARVAKGIGQEHGIGWRKCQVEPSSARKKRKRKRGRCIRRSCKCNPEGTLATRKWRESCCTYVYNTDQGCGGT